MPTILKAGNSSSGYSMTPGGDGELEIKTGSGAGTTALTLDASQNAVLAGNLQVAGSTTNLYPLVSGTAVPALGTSVDFTGIPSTATRITVTLIGVMANASWLPQIQLGDSGGIENTGYLGQSWAASATSGVVTSGLYLIYTALTTARVFHGSFQFVLQDSNTWIGTGISQISDASSVGNQSLAVKTLSGTLDRIRITTTGGTAAFNGGTINIMWE